MPGEMYQTGQAGLAMGRLISSRHRTQRSTQILFKRKQDVADDQTTKGYIPEAMTHTFSIQRRFPPSCLANATCKPWKHANPPKLKRCSKRWLCETLRSPQRFALEEVVARPPTPCGNVPLVIGHGREDAKLGIEIRVHRHDGRHVAAAVAVVGGRPDRDDGFLGEMELGGVSSDASVIFYGTNLVALVDQLMGPGNRCQPVDVVELGGHLVSKEPARTARTDSPCVDIFRIAPYKIAKGTLMRNLLGAGNDSDLVDGADLGAETAMDAEHGAVDDGR